MPDDFAPNGFPLLGIKPLVDLAPRQNLPMLDEVYGASGSPTIPQKNVSENAALDRRLRHASPD